MDEFKARRVVDALRDRGVNAHLFRGTVEFGVRVPLPGGREAEWDNDGTAGLEAQVMQDGDLADYDQPIGHQRTSSPPPAPALTREGGVFRRFIDGFRYR